MEKSGNIKNIPSPGSVLIILLGAALLLPSPGLCQEDVNLTRQDVQGTMEAQRLDEILSQYLAILQSLDPEEATSLGVHEMDNQLTLRQKGIQNQKLTSLKEFKKRIDEINTDSLSPETAVDAALLGSKLEVDIFNLENMDLLSRSPQYYISAMDSIYGVLNREFAPYTSRLPNALERLKKLPDILLQAEKNLSNPSKVPKIWVEQAIQQTDDTLKSFPEIVPMFRRITRYDQLVRDDLDKTVQNVKAGLVRYRDFLNNSILPHAAGDFRVGEDAYGFYLERWHHLPDSPSSMRRRAKRMFKQTLAELKKEALNIAPDSASKKTGWTDVFDTMNLDTPAEDELIRVFQQENNRAYEHFDKYRILPLPGERLRVRITPRFLQSVLPIASYSAPYPLDEKRVSEFFITPPDPALPENVRKKILRMNFNYPQIEMLVADEIMPGRHLRDSFSADTSKIRRIFNSPVTSNGWASYSEWVALDMGFYTSHNARLFYLKWKLLRAARAVIDSGLHTKKMTYDDALNFLREEAGLSLGQAKAEILKCSLRPTEGMSYLVGLEEILKLRKKYERSEDRQFRLRDFHTRFLKLGNVPLPMIKKELARQDEAREGQ